MHMLFASHTYPQSPIPSSVMSAKTSRRHSDLNMGFNSAVFNSDVHQVTIKDYFYSATDNDFAIDNV
jgi:hypothetical protein